MARIVGGELNWEGRQAVRPNNENENDVISFQRDPQRVFKGALELCWTFTDVYF